MISVSHNRNILCIEGKHLPMHYAVRETAVLGDKIIVLLDPDSYVTDPTYTQERRRGRNALHNLLALSVDGDLLWEAELPEPADYYYRISSHAPLSALSFSSFQCELDPETGKIKSKAFLK